MLAGRPDVLAGHGRAGHVPHHHRQGPGLHRHAGVPQQPEPGLPERARPRHRRPPTSFGEENLLSLPLDRYDDESIGVHEFCHTIDGTLARIDPTWRERLRTPPTRTRYRQGPLQGHLRRLQRGRILGRDRPGLFRLQPHQQLEPRPDRPRASSSRSTIPRATNWSRTTFNLSPSRTGATRFLQKLPSVIAAAGADSRSTRTTRSSPGRASSPCSGGRPATRPCSRPTTRSARCSPIATTS